MSESMDKMILHEDIIVETVSSTKRIEKGNITPPIASWKQTKDIQDEKYIHGDDAIDGRKSFER